MVKLHGPWTDQQLGRGNRTPSDPSTERADRKNALITAARSKQCACDLCKKNGKQRGLPENVMWCREGEDRYIVQRPGGV